MGGETADEWIKVMSDSDSVDDEFWLYDLEVETIQTDRPMVCGHRMGESFRVEGENLVFGAGQIFSLYALAALLPLLPAKQRPTDENDWMSTDDEVACPDANCGARFRITRTGKRPFRHSETSGLARTRDLR